MNSRAAGRSLGHHFVGRAAAKVAVPVLASLVLTVVGGALVVFWINHQNAERYPDYPAAVSEAEARTLLQGFVGAAAQERWSDICGAKGAHGIACENGTVLSEYRAKAPTGQPVVVGGRATGNRQCHQLPGYVLELEGTNGVGAPYRSDFYVARDFDGDLLVSMPVFWASERLATAESCEPKP